jgi:hypothetical protein
VNDNILLQNGSIQLEFDYMRESKCEQVFLERGKFDYARSAKHAVTAYKMAVLLELKTSPVLCMHLYKPRTWTDSLDKRPKRRNMDNKFGTWNVRSLYWAGSLVTVSKELLEYMLELMRLYRSSGGTR